MTAHRSQDEIVYMETQQAWSNRFLTTIMLCESGILTIILIAFALKAAGPDRVAILVAWVVCVVIMPTLILSIRLRIRIRGDELRVWFPPFPGWRIDLKRVVDAQHQKLRPIGDLGGWGYKVTRKHGHVHNLYGEQFVIIVTDDDRVRTIGTQRPQELLMAVHALAGLPSDESEIDLTQA